MNGHPSDQKLIDRESPSATSVIGIEEKKKRRRRRRKKSKHDYQFVEQKRQSLKFFSHQPYQTDTPSTYSINHVSLFAKILFDRRLHVFQSITFENLRRPNNENKHR